MKWYGENRTISSFIALIKVIYTSQRKIKTLETRSCTCCAVKCRITGTTISLKLEVRHKSVFSSHDKIDELHLNFSQWRLENVEFLLQLWGYHVGSIEILYRRWIASHCFMAAEIKDQATHKLGLTSWQRQERSWYVITNGWPNARQWGVCVLSVRSSLSLFLVRYFPR